MPASSNSKDLMRERVDMIWDAGLDIRKKCTLFYIADRCGWKKKNGRCFAHMETIARALSLSLSQTHANIKDLVGDGFVNRQRARYRASTLTINWERLAESRNPRILRDEDPEKPESPNPGARIPESQSQNPGFPGSSPYKQEHSVNTQRNTHRRDSKETLSEQAEQLYKAYPKHVEKQRAITAIIKALKVRPFDELMESVTAFADATAGANRQFIKGPAAWFDAGCYDDDRSNWATIGRERRNGHVNGHQSGSLAAMKRRQERIA